MIKDILKKHKAYTLNLELDLLRYFEKIRNEILKNLNASHQANPADKIKLGEILQCPSCKATGKAEIFRC